MSTAITETGKVMDYMKTTTSANGVDMKPIALTEWNIFAVGSQQMVSDIAGLHAVMVLGELVKNKFGEASRWDLANGWNDGNDHGMFNIGDAPGEPRWNPRPAFYYLYYFRQYFGDRMIASTVQGSNDILSYASSFSSGQAGVVIVNKGTATKVVQLTLEHFKPGDRYYWYTLRGGNDGGQFSRRILINGHGPAGVAGGPADYKTIKAHACATDGCIKVSVPPYSATFLFVEK